MNTHWLAALLRVIDGDVGRGDVEAARKLLAEIVRRLDGDDGTSKLDMVAASSYPCSRTFPRNAC